MHALRLILTGALAASAVSSATAQADEIAGKLERFPAFATRMITPREVDVWLPPGYDTHPSARYPVIYMMDGQNLFFGSNALGGVSWGIDRAMARLMAEDGIAGAIVVGVWNPGTADGRMSEYMPAKAVPSRNLKDVANAFNPPSTPIISDAFLASLVGEIKPFVDRQYRTLQDSANTFVMGSSFGGLISVYALCEYPSVFGAAACVSTHWPAGNGSVIDYLRDHLPDPATHRIYFDHGTETLDALYAPFQEKADDVLYRRGYRQGSTSLSRIFPGAEHSERSWRERAEIPLSFLLEGTARAAAR